MPGRIEQHVPDRIPNFARSLQYAHVVAIRQQPATPSESYDRPLTDVLRAYNVRSPPHFERAIQLEPEWGARHAARRLAIHLLIGFGG